MWLDLLEFYFNPIKSPKEDMEEDILGSPEELLAKQHRREKKDLQGI